MSGICGIYYFEGRPLLQDALAGMLAQLAHRGPDGSGLWALGSAGVGHCLLRTTPESFYDVLPRVHGEGQRVITADVRLDNRTTLLKALSIDYEHKTVTDSQLILLAYEKWGDRCCEHLLGDFAFAIWDERSQHFFLGRDHFGVKPLYYYCDRHIFAFATEIKALLALPEVPRQLNPVKVGDYLVSLFEDTTITFYQGISRLSPAHTLTIGTHSKQHRAYWALDPHKEITLGSNEEYAEALREKFKTAVDCRLRSAFPVGALLSGGLDSSSITCMARNLLVGQGKPPLKTFSSIFETITSCDEQPFIQAVIEQGNLEAYYIKADQIGPLKDLEKVHQAQDEALYAPNLFMHSAMYEAAHKQGVRVLLDGFDGDTTISHGFPYITELARNGKWMALLLELQGFSKKFDRPLGALLWKYLWRQGLSDRLPRPIRHMGNRLHHHISPKKQTTLSIQGDFARSIQLRSRIRQQHKKAAPSAREAHCQKLSWGVLPFTLETADKAAATCCIEPRYPFFDKRLVEFCLAIPPQQKIHHGWTRMVMRRAMNNILPTKVQWRGGKSDLSPNFHYGLKTLNRDCLERVLREETDLIAPYIDVTVLHRTYQKFISDESMPDSDVMAIWKPVTLALWLKYADFEDTLSKL